MLDQIAAALDAQDYQTAARLLRPLLKQSPTDPWVRLYTGRLKEGDNQSQAAEAIYRKLLKETTNPRIAIQARQGLQRLDVLAQQRRQAAIAEASANPLNTGTGFLLLEPLSGQDRAIAAQQFARIMKLDPYTARLHLPSRGWRLYRTGALGEIQVYSQELCDAGVPAFWVALNAIQAIRVFRVHYFQTTAPNPTVICQNEAGQMGSLAFSWSDVAQRVEGRLPIFEEVVDLDARNRLKRKEQTQDYAQVCDLHLPERHCILRICDNSYQFQKGVNLNAEQQASSLNAQRAQLTNRLRWNKLVSVLDHHLSEVPVWSEFTTFAEMALDQLDFVNPFDPHIDLFRKSETHWDQAFQLYSGIVFLQKTSH